MNAYNLKDDGFDFAIHIHAYIDGEDVTLNDEYGEIKFIHTSIEVNGTDKPKNKTNYDPVNCGDRFNRWEQNETNHNIS